MEAYRFKPFSIYEKVRVYRCNLPHWRQDGCTYFVTFRTDDSLPAAVVKSINDEQLAWLRGRGVALHSGEDVCDVLPRLSGEDLHRFHISFCRAVNRHLDDCHGACLLRDLKFSEIVMNALQYFDGKRMWLGDTVVMPNHVHVLICPIGEYELEDILQSIKSFSAREINAVTCKTGSHFWQRDTYDHIVRTESELEAYRTYIAGNPLKAKLSSGEYCYRSVG